MPTAQIEANLETPSARMSTSPTLISQNIFPTDCNKQQSQFISQTQTRVYQCPATYCCFLKCDEQRTHKDGVFF